MAEPEIIVDFAIDRTPTASPTMLELFMRDEFTHLNVTQRPCGFCEEQGHTIMNCQHPHIDLLHRSAMFIYLINIRYLKSIRYDIENHKLFPFDRMNEPSFIHAQWLYKLTLSEKKILGRINNIDITEMYGDLFLKLHGFYIDYAMNELRNHTTANSRLIQDIYYRHMENITTTDIIRRYGDIVLNEVIVNSGRHLLNFERIKNMILAEMSYYVERQTPRDTYFENSVFHRGEGDSSYPLNNYFNTFMNETTQPNETNRYLKQAPKIVVAANVGEFITNDCQTPECPICYNELHKNTNCVTTACNHGCCYECIIQLANNTKQDNNISCFMCRSNIDKIVVPDIEVARNIVNNTMIGWDFGDC
jgi:hypothetical protein